MPMVEGPLVKVEVATLPVPRFEAKVWLPAGVEKPPCAVRTMGCEKTPRPPPSIEPSI